MRGLPLCKAYLESRPPLSLSHPDHSHSFPEPVLWLADSSLLAPDWWIDGPEQQSGTSSYLPAAAIILPAWGLLWFPWWEVFPHHGLHHLWTFSQQHSVQTTDCFGTFSYNETRSKHKQKSTVAKPNSHTILLFGRVDRKFCSQCSTGMKLSKMYVFISEWLNLSQDGSGQ